MAIGMGIGRGGEIEEGLEWSPEAIPIFRVEALFWDPMLGLLLSIPEDMFRLSTLLLK